MRRGVFFRNFPGAEASLGRSLYVTFETQIAHLTAGNGGGSGFLLRTRPYAMNSYRSSNRFEVMRKAFDVGLLDVASK